MLCHLSSLTQHYYTRTCACRQAIRGLLLLPWSIGSRGFFIPQDRFWFLVPIPRAPGGL